MHVFFTLSRCDLLVFVGGFILLCSVLPSELGVGEWKKLGGFKKVAVVFTLLRGDISKQKKS